MKTGLSFRDLLIHRKEIGSYLGGVDELCDTIAVSLAEGKTMSLVAETSRDHFVQIVNVPMVGGGWVAMHEDVTERQQLLKARDRAEEAEREQKLQLDTALKNMVHGLCMFDGEGRILLFNRRYPEMMGLSAEYLHGRSLLDVFKHRKSTAILPATRRRSWRGSCTTCARENSRSMKGPVLRHDVAGHGPAGRRRRLDSDL